MKGPAMAPVNVGGVIGEEESWRHFNNSISAISFGFVATAILISMFLVMAIFERFLRSTSTTIFLSDDQTRGRRRRRRSSSSAADLESQQRNYARKLDCPNSPKMSVYAKGVSVLMPGNDFPTFIAHPAPAPCPPERISWPSHQHIPTAILS